MRATKIYENIKHLFWAAVWGFVIYVSWSIMFGHSKAIADLIVR